MKEPQIIYLFFFSLKAMV